MCVYETEMHFISLKHSLVFFQFVTHIIFNVLSSLMYIRLHRHVAS
jgi:hypothetical protein